MWNWIKSKLGFEIHIHKFDKWKIETVKIEKPFMSRTDVYAHFITGSIPYEKQTRYFQVRTCETCGWQERVEIEY